MIISSDPELVNKKPQGNVANRKILYFHIVEIKL
jgi:hypothetical protein